MRVPGYNSPQRMTFHRLLPWILALLCIPALASNSWDVPAADFARQIAALIGPGTITLSVGNRSSLSDEDVLAIRRALERDLHSDGLSVRGKESDSAVRVTLSQNVSGLLWVAEVQEGAEIIIAMLPVSRLATAPLTPAAPSITLRANLVLTQAEPILDVAAFGGATDQHLAVLEPQHIKMYSQISGNWQAKETHEITHTQPFPRDLRGHIAPSTDHLFDVYLPGVVCSAAKIGDTWDLNVSCNESDDPWPLATQKAFYNSSRNFFTGVVTPGFGPKLPSFYSATELARAGGNIFLFNDLGGTVHVLEGNAHKTLIGTRDWGSDFTAVRSACGQGTQLLTSAAGWPVSDSLRAYEITGREATPVSAPYVFDGTITAVWPSSDAGSAVVVVQNQDSRYEAYSVSVVCNR